MSKNKAKDKKSRPLPKPNRQIPNSAVRKITSIVPLSSPLQNARDFPIYGCWIMEGWREAGITPVVVARQQTPDRIMFGVYMIDLYCLGVKDVFTRTDYTLNRFERELPELCSGSSEKCSVELAHEIIYGGLEYAEKIGFPPHPDFKRQMADVLLDPPDAHPRQDNVTFGKDGKPFYVSGPNDDRVRINHIVNTLKRTCGDGNFEVLLGFGDVLDL
jgi:hypothetical protein